MQKINVNTIQPGDNPPATCQDAPVLIELEELRMFLKDGVDFHAPKTTIMNHFSQPSNQYRPSEQKPAEEWVPQVGDEVVAIGDSSNRHYYISGITTKGFPIEYCVNGDWFEKQYLDLVQKGSATIQKGDTVIPRKFEYCKENSFINFIEPMSNIVGKEVIVQAEYTDMLDRVKIDHYTWPKSALTLVRKASTFDMNTPLVNNGPGTIIPVASDDVPKPQPIDLATAKELYKQGGKAAKVALGWYEEAELKEKVLPQTYEQLGEIDGYWIDGDGEIEKMFKHSASKRNADIYPTHADATAALAMAQLLQLRQAWLEIEVPGWVPDWKARTTQIKHIIVRENEELGHLAGCHRYSHFSFPNFKLANKFLTTFTDLLQQAFCIKQSPGK